MAKINQLDPHIADLIAAGEVVERPASVVKELMENAIDAGATMVTVELQRGGMSYIRVTDNGCGIAPEEAELAFHRHATSKIRTEADLEAIGTLGFRGEALAAIAAVSHVELLTRRAEDAYGTNLLLDAGTLRAREEVGGAVGTTMIVRDLFFNTPARLKFMKRDVAEGAAAFAVVQHTALSHPEVAVTFIREGRRELQTPGDGKTQSVLYAVLGREVALGYLPVKGTGEGIQVEGYVSMPACCRGTRGYQHFFVNGRYVKSRTMLAALEEAYKNQKMVGKFPGCVLYLTTGLGSVDVNVHPTKTEVKFTSDKKLFDAIYYTVKGALEQSAARLSLTLEEDTPDEPTPTEQRMEPPTPVQSPRSAVQNRPAARSATGYTLFPGRQNFYQNMTAAEYKAMAARERLEQKPPVVSPTPTVVEVHDSTPVVYSTELDPVNEAFRRREELADEPTLPAEEAPPARQERLELPSPVGEVSPALAESIVSIAEEAPPSWRIVGELFNTYILVEQGDTVLLIDKHAAHERMNFDRMKAEGYRPMAQQLLLPIVFSPAADEGEALLQNQRLLEDFGFAYEDFGDGDIIIRQIPGDVDREEATATLTELAEKLLTTGHVDPDAARDELLHTMACKAAIKGGQRNGLAELQVVAEAVMSNRVRYCPHGRPVAVELTRKQLEKQFRRIT